MVASPGSSNAKDLESDRQDNKLPAGEGSIVLPSHNTKNSSVIYLLYKTCVEHYQVLCDALRESTLEKAIQSGFDRDLSLAIIHDALSRFKVWAKNIAAHQKGHHPTSLDYRLKEGEDCSERVLKILEDLKDSLHSAYLIVSGKEPNETWQVGAVCDADDEDRGDPLTGAAVTSELKELFSAIESTNSSLMKLSMIIRNSPFRDDYLKAASRYKLDPRWDIGHVREKHGSAKRSSEWLVERLGKSITKRRQYLKYRKDHHGKLSRDWDDVPKENEAKEDEKPEKTIAETNLTKATTFVATSALPDEDGSEVCGSLGSQTSYEATVMGEAADNRLTVPQHPTMAFEGIPFQYGEPFQCPYCYTEQTVKNRAGWKKHVFRDLKPYVCTFKECDLRMFSSRNEWFAHEIQNHRREWTCPYCQREPFSARDKFSKHLGSAHHGAIAGSQLEALVLQSEEPVDKIAASACQICDDWEANLLDSKQDSKRAFLNEGMKVEPYGTLAQFRRHLGRHMEQLALFALPINEGKEAEDESGGQIDDDESTCLKKLTKYSAFSLRKAPPKDPKIDKPTWARSEVIDEKWSQEDIIKQMKKLNERGRSLPEKKASLAPNQSAQITRLLDDLSSGEPDRNFDWTLVQLDRKEKILKHGLKETLTMTAIVKRSPLKDLNPVILYRNIERAKHERMMYPETFKVRKGYGKGEDKKYHDHRSDSSFSDSDEHSLDTTPEFRMEPHPARSPGEISQEGLDRNNYHDSLRQEDTQQGSKPGHSALNFGANELEHSLSRPSWISEVELLRLKRTSRKVDISGLAETRELVEKCLPHGYREIRCPHIGDLIFKRGRFSWESGYWDDDDRINSRDADGDWDSD